MFDTYLTMNDEERTRVKAIHRAVRADASCGERTRILAWAFVRGMKYRRAERSTRTQTLGDGSVVEHNRPSAGWITLVLARAIPGFAGLPAPLTGGYQPMPTPHPDVVAWLDDPSGAIPAPPPRPRAARAVEEKAAAE